MNDSTGGIQQGGDHYKGFPIQPIDYAEENKLTATEFSVVKYVTRHRTRGEGLKDIKKAFHFLQMLAKRFYGLDVLVDYHDPEEDEFVEQELAAEDEEDEIEYPDTEAGRFSRGVDEMDMDEVRNIVAAAIVACRYKGSPETIEHLERILRIIWPSGIPRVDATGNSLYSKEQELAAEDEEDEIEYLPSKPCDAYVRQRSSIELLGDVADSEDVDIRDRGKAMTELRNIALDAGIPLTEILAARNWRSIAKRVTGAQCKQEVRV